jgi:hypothetical protein
MSSALVRHGWEIVFQPQLIARQYEQLKAEVKRLKQELDQQSLLQLSGEPASEPSELASLRRATSWRLGEHDDV